MSDLEIRTELHLIRRDVDDIKLLIPDIRNALQQLAVTNAQLVSNMDEHKIIWQHVNGLKEKCEDQVIPHITVWGGHREEHNKIDSILYKIKEEHAVCMAERANDAAEDKEETLLDKVMPQLVASAITAIGTGAVLLVLLHASDLLNFAR